MNERTPRLVLDERRLDANIARAQARAEAAGAGFRPHFKTHKSPEILRRQLAAGAAGVTVATLREADIAIDAGAADVLVAYPPVGDWRLAGIAALLDRARVIVACSEPGHVRALAGLGRPIAFYWEVDTGTGRIGTPPGEPTAAAVAAALAEPGELEFAGLMAFAGHAYAGDGGPDARAAAATAESGALAQTVAALRARGIASPVVSTGTTPIAGHDVPGATELRWGNAVFFDAMQVALGSATLDDCALAVETTVVARPASDRVILDAGSKALAAERMREGGPFGLVRDHPELIVERLYEEHAICRADGGSGLALGDRVEVVPAHACTCANLHAAYAVRLPDGGEARWPVVARGWGDDLTVPAGPAPGRVRSPA